MIKALVNNQTEFQIEKEGTNYTVNQQPVVVDSLVEGNRAHVLVNNQSYNVEVLESNHASKSFKLKVNGNLYDVVLKDRYDDLLHQLGFDKILTAVINDIKAPMPGLVVDILVSTGQEIKKGDSVVILEAMKMENVLKAPADAIVKSIKTKKGNKVEKNEVLVTLE